MNKKNPLHTFRDHKKHKLLAAKNLQKDQEEDILRNVELGKELLNNLELNNTKDVLSKNLQSSDDTSTLEKGKHNNIKIHNVAVSIDHLKHKLLEEDDLQKEDIIEKINAIPMHDKDLSTLTIEEKGVVLKSRKKFTDRLFVKKFENIKETFQEGLDDMLKAGIINEEQKKEIHESLKSPQVMESIKVWAAVFGFSGFYIGVNTVTITPLTALIGGPVAGFFSYLVMYLLKRVFISGIVKYFGKNLERKDYISNMSLIPILGEQIALIELYKKYPLAAQYFYAFMRTGKTRKNYIKQEDLSEKGIEKKQVLRDKWEKKINKNVNGMKTISDGLVDFETGIGNFFRNAWRLLSLKKRDNNNFVE